VIEFIQSRKELNEENTIELLSDLLEVQIEGIYRS